MHLYIHIPFCARRCSYCDFAIAVRREVPSSAYADALLAEWDSWQSHEVWNIAPAIETIYFGGGTPSLLDPDAIERLLDRFRARRPVSPEVEITLETNPDDVTSSRAARWKRMGINRISMGVQSFDPAVLRWMHRTHDAAAAATAVSLLRSAGFGNVSLDLIFGLPAALGRDWQYDLDQALALAPEHLSLYGLTVEQRTPLFRWVERGEVVRVDDDTYATEFLAADVALRSAGMAHYEVSNAGRPGFYSRHNSAYWQRRPFIGLGPSAHSGWNTERRWNLREWAAYAHAIQAGQPVLEGTESLSPESVALENLYLGLRTTKGIPAEWITESTRAVWIEAGWARVEGSSLVLTIEGWLRLDALVSSVSQASDKVARHS
ncbi:MAG: radical SAM family heme chaperone HemW [Gemmatimonadota bacterium]